MYHIFLQNTIHDTLVTLGCMAHHVKISTVTRHSTRLCVNQQFSCLLHVQVKNHLTHNFWCHEGSEDIKVCETLMWERYTSVTSNRKKADLKLWGLISECCSPLCERATSIHSATSAQFYIKHDTWAYSYTVEPPLQIYFREKIFKP